MTVLEELNSVLSNVSTSFHGHADPINPRDSLILNEGRGRAPVAIVHLLMRFLCRRHSVRFGVLLSHPLTQGQNW